MDGSEPTKMKRALLQIAGLSLYGVFGMFLMSEAKIETIVIPDADFYGQYTLRSTGNLNEHLGGEVNFESSIETDKDRNTTSILKLKLGDQDNSLQHSIEFVISKKNASNQISKGLYTVSQKKKGFLAMRI